MKKIYPFLALSCLFLALACLSSCTSKEKTTTTIGIVVPMQHQALDDIVQGFCDTLLQKDPSLNIKVQNAQGDTSLQKAIIQQFAQQQVSLIVPIGLSTTQMSAHLVHSTPIVSLAAKIETEEKPSNLTGVNDELETGQILDFAQSAFAPKRLTLIHSPSEKIFPEVALLKELCLDKGIEVDSLMIQNQSDLYPMAQLISPQSDLILVLKDHMVVSGMSILAQAAQKLHIPLMASDDGSLKQGAAFSLGVKEYEIGVHGAHLAKRVLSGTSPSQMPIEQISSLHLFINKKACAEQKVPLEQLEKVALDRSLNIVYVE